MLESWISRAVQSIPASWRQRIIGQFHPKLLIELHHLDGRPQGHSVPPLLESLGYKIAWLDRWQWTSHIWAVWPASSAPLDST